MAITHGAVAAAVTAIKTSEKKMKKKRKMTKKMTRKYLIKNNSRFNRIKISRNAVMGRIKVP